MHSIASPGQLRASFWRWALVCVPLVVVLGFISGRASVSGPDNPWFAALVKPALYPPPITFAIVWTALYVMMGLAAALVGAARGARGRILALVVFVVQFLINLAWSPVFFGAHRMTAGLVVIGVLDVAVVITMALFWRIRRGAAWLLVPYLAWIVFATYLNYAFLVANPGLDGVNSSGAVQRIEFDNVK